MDINEILFPELSHDMAMANGIMNGLNKDTTGPFFEFCKKDIREIIKTGNNLSGDILIISYIVQIIKNFKNIYKKYKRIRRFTDINLIPGYIITDTLIIQRDTPKQIVAQEEELFKAEKGKIITIDGGGNKMPHVKQDNFICKFANHNVVCLGCNANIKGTFYYEGAHNYCVGCTVTPSITNNNLMVNYHYSRNNPNNCLVCNRVIGPNENYVFCGDNVYGNYICSCCGNSRIIKNKHLDYSDPDIFLIMVAEFLQDKLFTHYNIINFIREYIKQHGINGCLNNDVLFQLINDMFLSANLTSVGLLNPYNLLFQDNSIQQLKNILIGKTKPLTTFIGQYHNNI